MSSGRSRSGGMRKVAPVPPALDHFGQIAIRGDDQARVHARSAHAAETLERLVLKNARELGLGEGRKLAYFLQKESAAVREFESPFAQMIRAGKRAALVAEQLAFDQVLRQGRAIGETKGAFLLGAPSRIARAASSLPAPDSPWISAVVDGTPTIAIRA